MENREIVHLRNLRKKGVPFRELYRMYGDRYSKMEIRRACGVNINAIQEAKKFNHKNYFVESVHKRLYIEKRAKFKD